MPGLIAVGFDKLLSAFWLGFQAPEEMVECAHRANPAAEKTAEKECRNHDDQAPQQPTVESAARKHVRGRNQRVDLEE
jgi:hypothetical protein